MPDSAEPFQRPVVLCIVNRPNWAHDRKTDALARALGGAYEIVKRYQAEVSAAEDLLKPTVRRKPEAPSSKRRLTHRCRSGHAAPPWGS